MDPERRTLLKVVAPPEERATTAELVESLMGRRAGAALPVHPGAMRRSWMSRTWTSEPHGPLSAGRSSDMVVTAASRQGFSARREFDPERGDHFAAARQEAAPVVDPVGKVA